MKRVLKKQTIFPVAMLYCLMLGLFSTAVYGSANSFSNRAAKEETLQSTPALCTDFTIHTSNAINSVGNFNTAAPASLKNTVTGSSDSAKMIEQSFRRKFARYFFYMRNLLLRFRQCEIIFPFHYFW